MNQVSYKDEVGSTLGPQRAAEKALDVELAGMEPQGDSQAGVEGESGGNPAAPPLDSQASAEEWTAILKTGFGALFALLGARWRSFETTQQEIDALANAWTPVAVKHAGGSIPIEAVAALATIAIVAPKAVGAMREHKERRQAAAAERAHRDPGTHHA